MPCVVSLQVRRQIRISIKDLSHKTLSFSTRIIFFSYLTRLFPLHADFAQTQSIPFHGVSEFSGALIEENPGIWGAFQRLSDFLHTICSWSLY